MRFNELNRVENYIIHQWRCKNRYCYAGLSRRKNGLIKGDVIVKFDDKPVKNLRDYSNLLKEHQPGDVVTVEFVRDGERKTTKLTLAER